MYVVIMAGGGGTRLWPLSSPERPKPFLPLLGDRTLLQLSVDRLLGGRELGLGLDDVTVVTDGRYADLVRGQLPGVAVLEEPIGRNTAAAVALSTVAIERADDEVMLVLPADQTIERESVFRATLAAAAGGLARGAFGIASPLVTLGIEVSRPATEYGYLIPDLGSGAEIGGLKAYPLERFQEKPTVEAAMELQRRPGVAWNAGIFLWRRGAIRAALREFAPDVLAVVGEGQRSATLGVAYEAVRPISIDYAVLEPAATAGRVVMGAMDVGWNDLGGWTVLLEALGGFGAGRVVQAGEAAQAGPDDLVVERLAGRLALADGPRGIIGRSPSALLVGARPARAIVEALLDRVAQEETRG
jgi:mannose-1-phosphate guanylyltransferase